MQERQVAFPALFPQGTKLWVQAGLSFLSRHMQLERQPLYSTNIPAWVNPGAGTYGCSSKQRPFTNNTSLDESMSPTP